MTAYEKKKNIAILNVKVVDYRCSDYHVNVNKYGFKCATSLGSSENKGWINEIDPYGWFR